MDSFRLEHVYYVGICDIGKITVESATGEGRKRRDPQMYQTINCCSFWNVFRSPKKRQYSAPP